MPVAAATTTSTDDDPEHHRRVELATLSLPSELEGHAVLEASNETVEHLHQQQQQQQQQQDHPRQDQPSHMISAVVDLEHLSELVGVSEHDFIAGLHQMQTNVEENHRRAAADERLSKESTILQVAPADEESPLLGKDASTATSFTKDHIELPADPFLESLGQVVQPTITPGDGAEEEDDDTIFDGGVTVYTTEATTTGDNPKGGEEEEEDHPPPRHDAFLLNVPRQMNAHGNVVLEDHFVLALPEIHPGNHPALLVESSMSDYSDDDEDDEDDRIHKNTTKNDQYYHSDTDDDNDHEDDEDDDDEEEASWYFGRAFSMLPATLVLPSDVETLHLEATKHKRTQSHPEEVHLDIVVERKVPWIGYVILITGFTALASANAAQDLQQGGVTPLMKTLWKQMATCMVLFPVAVKSIHQDGVPCLSKHEVALLVLSGAAYAYLCLAFVLALEFTTLPNALVWSNMTPLILLAARASWGLPVVWLEGAGAMTGIVGAAIWAQDASHTDTTLAPSTDTMDRIGDTRSNAAFIGNSVAFSASFGTAGFLLIAKKLRPKMDLFVFMFAVMGVGSICLILFSLLSGQNTSFGLHPVHGILGWMNLEADRLPLELYMAIVCNCLGTTGYIAVMKYFDPIVPATVMLLEPVVWALLETAVGIAPLPGRQTWFGDLVVAGGTLLVIRAGAQKTESIDATKALRPRLDTANDDVVKPTVPDAQKHYVKRRGYDDKVKWVTK